MNKSSIEKMLKAEGHYAGDLVSLDFKSESLQAFLANVVKLVNQHSQRINALQIDKANTQDIRKGNAKMVNAGKINPGLAKQIAATNPTKADTFDQSVDSMSSNLTNHASALQYLLENMKQLDKKVDSLAGLLDTFETKQNSKELLRRAAQVAKKGSQDEAEKVLTRLKQLEMKTNKKISEFQNTTKQVQKKTLWKITECQTALSKRITVEYIEKALQQQYSKIMNDINNNKNQQLNEVKFNIQTLKARMDTNTRNIEEYQKQNKALIKELQQNQKSYEKKEKTQLDRRDNDVRFKEMLIKIDRLQKREDPKQLELRVTKTTSEHHEKLHSMSEKLKKIEQDLDSMNNVMSSMGGADGGGFDPHKLCQVDGQVKRLRDCNRSNEMRLHSLEDDVRMKLLTFEQRVMTTLGMLKTQDNFVSREQMYESLSRLREPVMQKLGENQTLIYEINGKLTKLQLFEKATKRKIKELTRGDDLNKILDLKMNTGQAQAQFNSVGMKLDNIEAIIAKMRLELQANSSFLSILEKEINEPEEGVNIIGPKQKVFPAKCLGCGQKHIPAVHDNSMMMGTDGKLYKVDMRNSGMMGQRQVYGVTQSQIAVYETGVKKRITSINTRPTSGRTPLRPSSAKHF